MEIQIGTPNNLDFNVGNIGGTVYSVNGKTGNVVLDYEDVHALSEDTELFSGDYNDLTNKPDIPTKTSELTNDSGFLTEHQSLEGYATEDWVEDQGYLTEHQDISGKADITYVDDQVDEVEAAITILNNTKADKTEIPTVPTNVSAFTNDAGYLTEHQSLAAYRTAAAQDVIDTGKVNTNVFNNHVTNTVIHTTAADKTTWNNKQDKLTAGANITIQNNVISANSGLSEVAWGGITGTLSNQTDLKNALDSIEDEIPTVPTNVSAFTNDAGYLTSHQSLSDYRTSAAQDIIDAGKQDTLTAGANITIDSNNVISASSGGSLEIFWCTYGQTTFAQALEAYNDGKLLLMNYINQIYTLTAYSAGGLVFCNIQLSGQFINSAILDGLSGWRAGKVWTTAPMSPSSGNYILKSINGTLQWVAE